MIAFSIGFILGAVTAYLSFTAGYKLGEKHGYTLKNYTKGNN